MSKSDKDVAPSPSPTPSAERNHLGHYLPGCTGNRKGRPKGSVSGRTKALHLLDEVVGADKNLKLLRWKLNEVFKKDPVRFFERFVMPLLPKEALVKLETVEKARVRVLIGNEKVKE
jgi:hypothetical protein